MTVDASQLAKQLTKPATSLIPQAGWRQGTISSVTTGAAPTVGVKLGGSSVEIPGVKWIAIGYTPSVGDVVWVAKNGEDYFVVGPVGVSLSPLRKRHYVYNADSLNSTSNVWVIQQNALIAADAIPYDYTMIVRLTGRTGFPAAANTLTLQIADETGLSILEDSDGAYQVRQHAANYHSVSVTAVKDYNAGAVAGFRIGYNVDTSNTYLRLVAEVEFQGR